MWVVENEASKTLCCCYFAKNFNQYEDVCVCVCSSVCSDTEIIPHRNEKKMHKHTLDLQLRFVLSICETLLAFSSFLILLLSHSFGCGFIQKITFFWTFSIQCTAFSTSNFFGTFSLNIFWTWEKKFVRFSSSPLKNVTILNS